MKMRKCEIVFKKWMDLDRVEAWMEQQAQEGWVLERISRTGFRIYFRKEEPRRAAYSIDYRDRKVSADYEQIFTDSGWQLVWKSMGYYVWRQYYEGESKPEAFSDAASQYERQKRILMLMFFTLLTQIGAISTLIRNISEGATMSRGLLVFVVVLDVMILWGFIQTYARMYHFRKQMKQ